MRRAAFILAWVAALTPGLAQTYDVLIRGGQLIDGTGAVARTADVALKGERIAAVGDLRAATAAKIVSAAGLVVAPGFIDAHSHLGDHELLRAELAGAEPMLAQGVTTVLINSDGWGIVDLSAQRKQIETARPGVNVAMMIGHRPVRMAVLGFTDRTPNAAELERMRELVRTAFARDGAFGISTGLIYAPASYAKTPELIELTRVAAEYGGFYHSHIRDESDGTVGWMTAIDELITIAREAKTTGIVTHIKAGGPKCWGRAPEAIARINAARAAGVSVWADQYPYEAGTTYLASIVLPGWAQADGPERMRERLADPETRAKIRTEMIVNIERRSGPSALLIARNPVDPSLEGRRLDEIGRQRRMEPVDVAIELIRRGDPIAVAFSMRDADIVELMRQPWTMTGSDGFGIAEVHPRSYGTFTRKLRVFSLDRKVIPLERAIHSMSGQPADVLGLKDRGVVRAGAFADVVVFDPAQLRDNATYEKPRALASGMVQVFVNGKPALADGKPTTARSGRVLGR
jgi:N-acyl-D-amino-acid deacylase